MGWGVCKRSCSECLQAPGGGQWNVQCRGPGHAVQCKSAEGGGGGGLSQCESAGGGGGSWKTGSKHWTFFVPMETSSEQILGRRPAMRLVGPALGASGKHARRAPLPRSCTGPRAPVMPSQGHRAVESTRRSHNGSAFSDVRIWRIAGLPVTVHCTDHRYDSVTAREHLNCSRPRRGCSGVRHHECSPFPHNLRFLSAHGQVGPPPPPPHV